MGHSSPWIASTRWKSQIRTGRRVGQSPLTWTHREHLVSRGLEGYCSDRKRSDMAPHARDTSGPAKSGAFQGLCRQEVRQCPGLIATASRERVKTVGDTDRIHRTKIHMDKRILGKFQDLDCETNCPTVTSPRPLWNEISYRVSYRGGDDGSVAPSRDTHYVSY